MKMFRALLVGVVFLLVTPLAMAYGHPDITKGPLWKHQNAVMAEAARLGQSTNPAFLDAQNELRRATAKYAYDIGIVADCQTGAIGVDRAIAFAAINRMVDVLPGSTVGHFTPETGMPHSEVVQAVQTAWPALKSQPQELLAEAGIAEYVASLVKRAAQVGEFQLTPTMPQHWSVTHPFATEVVELEHRLDMHLEHQHQWRMKMLDSALFCVALLLMLGFAIKFMLEVTNPPERPRQPIFQAE